MTKNMMTADYYHTIIKKFICHLYRRDDIREENNRDIIQRINCLIYKMAFPDSELLIEDIEDIEGVPNEDIINNEYYIRITTLLETYNWQLFTGGLTDDQIKNLINTTMANINELVVNL
jgi:hypothetical protein